MYRDIGIYSFAGTLETLVTHPIEVIRTRYVNRTQLWRGVRGIYPGIGIQLAGFVPERIVFVGARDVAKRNGYCWWEYSPVVSFLQTCISAPFVSWKVARIEDIPLTKVPHGVAALYVRNTIFATCLFASKDELSAYPSMITTVAGVGSGVLLSHPFDVMRVMKQSMYRDKTHRELLERLSYTSAKEGYVRTLWRGCVGRLTVACIGITTMIETTAFLKKIW